jgi:preprotein translocase subunit SecD
MPLRKKSLILLVVIIAVTILSGFFVYPEQEMATEAVDSETASGTVQIEAKGEFRPWKLGLDLVGGSHLVYEVDVAAIGFADVDSVINGLRDVIERRVNLFGVSEPNVVSSQSGDSYRLIVELAGIKDTAAAIQQIGTTPFLMFAETEEVDTSSLASNLVIETEGGEQIEVTPNVEQETDQAGPTYRFVPTNITGRYIEGAQVSFDNITSRPIVFLRFNEEGADLFEQLTEKNIGEPIAVFLDGELITAPTVSQVITGGQAQITGDFTLDEAKDLVERFNAGALPAPITLISQQTVGASLGTDSLTRMLKAGALGVLLVIIFMVIYYRNYGVFSSLALIVYTLLSLAIFKLFGITMTLAGIAGFILSIGMAVDANILIFERTKEEEKQGSNKETAIEDGFKRAWPAIRDSNITTIITTIILFYFTSGFVRGFALTLMIGVIISMFSAITVTRTMLRVFVRNKQNINPETLNK